MLYSVFLTALLAGLCTALTSAAGRAESRKGFSLEVEKSPGAKRDFVRDWAAARQKWGKGVPSEVSSMFSLLDSGEPFSRGKGPKSG